MKVVQFTIPVPKKSTVVIQENIAPHYYNHFHRHQEIQIEFVKSGSGTLITGNYMQAFQDGDIYVIGPNQPHIFKSDDVYFLPNSEKKIHSLSIFFNPKQLRETLFLLPELESIQKFILGLKNGLQIPENSKELIINTISELQNAKESIRISIFIKLLNQLSTLKNPKLLSSTNNEQIISEGEGIRMDQIFQYVVSNYKQHITLKEISKIANLTPQAFCRYFKKHTEKTFIEFLNEIRINEACKIIVSRQFTSFADVSAQTGFDNVSNFNRVFKKTMLKSPRQYQKEFKNKLMD
jgi:AraC-like DNA-binding protein